MIVDVHIPMYFTRQISQSVYWFTRQKDTRNERTGVKQDSEAGNKDVHLQAPAHTTVFKDNRKSREIGQKHRRLQKSRQSGAKIWHQKGGYCEI